MNFPWGLKSLFGVIACGLIVGFFLGMNSLPAIWQWIPAADLERALVKTLPFAQTSSSGTAGLIQSSLSRAGLPRTDSVRPPVDTASRGGLLVVEERRPASPQAAAIADTAAKWGDEPLVCVYCTHTTENYAGETRGHQAGGVLKAAAALRDSLERQGLKTVLCETVHDAPDWSGAYGSSLASIEALKKQYPSLQVFVDVHRDSAIAGVSTKLKTAGEDVAKIMFVVGSNQRLAHPQWQQNQDFSQDLADLLETMAPDIIRGVRVSASRYNQHISTKAMLVEIGSTENTVEEAQRSAALLGEALAQLLAKDV